VNSWSAPSRVGADPNILAIHDVGSHDGTVYAVTELLEGQTLRERLAAGALPSRKAVEIAIQIANGLAAAHEKGIVHRDLKPEIVQRRPTLRVQHVADARCPLPHRRREAVTVGETVSGSTLTRF
jgi:serine/threonine protein kinase